MWNCLPFMHAKTHAAPLSPGPAQLWRSVTKRARIESPRSGIKARIEPTFYKSRQQRRDVEPIHRHRAFVGDKSRSSGRFGPTGYNPRHLATSGGTINRIYSLRAGRRKRLPLC
jgi:hypothetical protein